MAKNSEALARVAEDSITPCAVVELAQRHCVALLTMGGLPPEHPNTEWCLAAFRSVGSGSYPSSPPELNALGAELEAEPDCQNKVILWLGVRLAFRCSVAIRRRQGCQCARTALERELTEEMAQVLAALPKVMDSTILEADSAPQRSASTLERSDPSVITKIDP